MLYVAAGALLVALTCGVTMLALSGVIRSQARTHARERELLVNQLLHSVGKTWQPAPAAFPTAAEPLDEDEWFRRHEPMYYASPEQDPEVLA